MYAFRYSELKKFIRMYYDNNITYGYQYEVLTSEDWEQLKLFHSTRCYKIDNRNTQKRLWNFWSSLDFCSTVLTTIGYGNMYPKTDTGKFFTTLYSLVGIPLMAVYLTIFSRGIYRITSSFLRRICIWVNIKVIPMLRSDNGKGPKVVTNIQFKAASLLFLFSILAIWVSGLSLLLHKTNVRDSILACHYFYIMTLTTVGIGDISMTEANPLVLFRVLLVFCVGLTLVTVCFSAVRNIILENKKKIRKPQRRTSAWAFDQIQRAQEVSMNLKRRLSRPGRGRSFSQASFSWRFSILSRGSVWSASAADDKRGSDGFPKETNPKEHSEIQLHCCYGSKDDGIEKSIDSDQISCRSES